MPNDNAQIVFSPSARAQQVRHGSRDSYAKMEQTRGFQADITPELAGFIAERDSLYLGTVSADGWPYIQHRGGAKGFIKVLDDRTLAFADFAGNRQYISMGNLDDNDRAFIFLMDYANRRRIKIWGRAKFIEDDPALLARLTDPEYPAHVERALVFTVEAWDVNCKQHIKPRYDDEQVAEIIAGQK
ncbi:pyridoxamine 5'-phosphate oxidase [Planctomycetales bacterium ZRK34]|nr:pyridoxamine 5'-phosphate oxidase [Planctomycetales bacterium ZRK34]